MNKVIIVDDHALFARSLAGLINTFPDYEVIEIFKNGQELVEMYASNQEIPSIILLDVKMPIMDGLTTMKWLKNNKPEALVLVITMEDNEQTIISMLKDGAKGYLLKDTEPETLKLALDTILNKGFFSTELTTKALMHSINGEIELKKSFDLKDNELKFIKLACQEKTYKEIADEMFLSPKTIDGYRQHLFDKLEVKNRTGLVVFAIKNKIIEI